MKLGSEVLILDQEEVRKLDNILTMLALYKPRLKVSAFKKLHKNKELMEFYWEFINKAKEVNRVEPYIPFEL